METATDLLLKCRETAQEKDIEITIKFWPSGGCLFRAYKDGESVEYSGELLTHGFAILQHFIDARIPKCR